MSVNCLAGELSRFHSGVLGFLLLLPMFVGVLWVFCLVCCFTSQATAMVIKSPYHTFFLCKLTSTSCTYFRL